MISAPPSALMPTLPGRYYTDPEIFEREKRRIFERQWMYACRGEDLPAPGHFVRCRLGDESVLVVRGRDHQLRAFLNVCRHRGAQLCLTDSGDTGKAIRCPYHSWSYDLAGTLVAMPNWKAMAEIDKSRYGLHPVHLAEWHGMVWLSLADNPEPLTDQVRTQLDYRLGGDREKFVRYGLAELQAGRRIEYEVAANWKIIQENFQECYHCGTIHPELVRTIPYFRNLKGKKRGQGYNPDGHSFADDVDSFSLSGRVALPKIPGLKPDDDRKYYGMVVRPNCFISLLPDHAIVHRVEMISAEATKVVCEWLFPPETLADESLNITDTVELFHRINQQDFAACAWCQPNMRSRAYRDGGVLVPSEEEIIGRWYYGWYHQAMGLEWDKSDQ